MKKYTQSHEWIEIEGQEGSVGISDYAQKELGDIVYVELPRIGHRVKVDEEAAVLESTKAAADVYSPMSGEIIAVNDALLESPDKVNRSAEGDGWLFKIKISNPDEANHLMDEKKYLKFIGGK